MSYDLLVNLSNNHLTKRWYPPTSVALEMKAANVEGVTFKKCTHLDIEFVTSPMIVKYYKSCGVELTDVDTGKAKNPFVVLLGKGYHPITSSWTARGIRGYPNGYEYLTTLALTLSNITFVGTGKDTTTILGGFHIEDVENITFKNMTVTNTSEEGDAICMCDAKVELIDVAFNGCGEVGLRMQDSYFETTVVATRCAFANNEYGTEIEGELISATFNNCVFHDNDYHGMFVSGNATIHLHGEATAVHSNGNDGIHAMDSGKVIIHLPSHHNISYNNGTTKVVPVRGHQTTSKVNQWLKKQSWYLRPSFTTNR